MVGKIDYKKCRYFNSDPSIENNCEYADTAISKGGNPCGNCCQKAIAKNECCEGDCYLQLNCNFTPKSWKAVNQEDD